MEEAYSSWAVLKCCRAVSLTLGNSVGILCLMNPRVRFAFPVILFMCEFHDKTLEMSNPKKYLTLVITCTTCPYR